MVIREELLQASPPIHAWIYEDNREAGNYHDVQEAVMSKAPVVVLVASEEAAVNAAEKGEIDRELGRAFDLRRTMVPVYTKASHMSPGSPVKARLRLHGETGVTLEPGNEDPRALENLTQIVRSALTDHRGCLLYTSPSPRDQRGSRMPSSA